VAALKDVSFVVDRGEAFGIIGRNGSGKSTLLKVISGILKPTSGNVRVNGRVAALIELGAGFHPEITGRENIVINGIMLGLSRREVENRFDAIVEFSGIREFIDQPVKTYSSGMYVRLGFAVAVHVDPEILLIDEVLAVGDEEFSQKCIAKIQEMKYRGVTLLFVTHQLDQVRNLCDRAMWLDHGALEAIGDPARVVDHYLQAVSGGQPSRQSRQGEIVNSAQVDVRANRTFLQTFRKCSACVSSTTVLRMESSALSLMAVSQRWRVFPFFSFGISSMTCCHVLLAPAGSPAFQ